MQQEVDAWTGRCARRSSGEKTQFSGETARKPIWLCFVTLLYFWKPGYTFQNHSIKIVDSFGGIVRIEVGGGKLEDKIEVSVSVSWLSLYARVSALASQQGGGITFEDFSICFRFQ